MQIILASRSPRRKLLLEKIIGDFSIQPSTVDESLIIAKTPRLFALAAAMAKAQDVSERSPQALVIAADTVVILDKKILGKPADKAQASKMLKKLSGRGHSVLTALALARDAKILASGCQETKVFFNRLSAEDIEGYAAGGDPLDKAGAYGIQTIGEKFVKKITGDYDNVVGLPTTLLKKLLADFADYDEVLEITDVALPIGAGVAKKDGKVFFVSGAVYGDTVRAKVTSRKKNLCYANTVRIEKASPYRAKPKCRHFGVCGGCIFQDLAYPKQIEIKTRHLLNTLRRLGGLDFPADRLEIIEAAKKYFYRNKMEFVFGREADRIILGLKDNDESYGRGGRVVDLVQCPIFSRKAGKIFEITKDFFNNRKSSVYDPSDHRGILKRLVVKESKTNGKKMVVLTICTEMPFAEAFSAGLMDAVKEVQSVWLAVSRTDDVNAFETIRHVAGEKHIQEILGDFTFNIWPQTFFQTSTSTAALLYQKVKDFFPAKKTGQAMGLYCGSGALEVFCSTTCDAITGVDNNPANIDNAKQNTRINNITNCSFWPAKAEEITTKVPYVKADLVIVDPPRQGLNPQVLERLQEISAPAIIYVSCEPASLSRDLKILCANGYRIRRLAMVDMFPQTGHLEAVALLTRS